MVKDFIIVILLILLALCSYLLYDSRETIFGDWPLLGSGRELEPKKSDKAPDLDQNDAYKAETLKPQPTPEINRDPTIGLDLDTVRSKEAETGVIVFRYSVIRPTILKITDSKGNTAAEVNLETGETLFGSEYTPDEASIEFWKSIADNYPEICTIKETEISSPHEGED